MNKQLTLTFDGQVFHPEKETELTPNTRYIISIISEMAIDSSALIAILYDEAERYDFK